MKKVKEKAVKEEIANDGEGGMSGVEFDIVDSVNARQPAVSVKCTDCIYGSRAGCRRGKNEFTYDAIKYAKSPEALLTAFRNRADHIEKLIEGK